MKSNKYLSNITIQLLIVVHIVDSSKMLSHFLRAMSCCRSLPCPAGEAGSGRPRSRECDEEAPGATKCESGSFSSENDKTGATRGRFALGVAMDYHRGASRLI